ncbi:hypothetical protein ACIBUY_19005 [Streptomyces sp. NPDC050085]
MPDRSHRAYTIFRTGPPNSTDKKTWWKLGAVVMSGLAYKGYKNAYNLLMHYMENSGDDYWVDPAEMLQDLPGFRDSLGETLQKYKGKSKFDSGWVSTRASEKESMDWYYALNGFQYRVQGRQVTDGEGNKTMVAQLSVYKRYNWGNGTESVPRKPLHLGPMELTQPDIAHLHVAGMAQEYDVRGVTTFSIEGW